jgi:hypothetical protein
MKPFLWIFLGFSMVTFPLLAAPPAIESDYGLNSLMLSGAYSTGGLDMDAFRGNPAVMAYRFGQSGFGGGWQKNPSAGSSWQVAMIDGARSLVNGLHFQWWEQGSVERKGFTLGGAYRTPYGTAGLSSSLLHFSGFPKGNGWHLTTAAGILTPALHGLTLGISVKNLIDRAEKTLLPPELAMGINFHQEFFGLHFQADRRFAIDDAEWSFSTAGEVVMREFFALKGGYRFERSADPSFYSLGLGIIAPKIDLSAVITRSTGAQARWGYGFHCLFLF